MNDISVLAITYNEEVNLPFLLKNVQGWAQEVIILDSGSTDNTMSIAKQGGCKIFHRDFDNFSNQRKHLLNNIPVSTSWVLVLDADEYLTEELKSEISKTIIDSQYDAFIMKRRFYWMGNWVKRGYYPTNLLRLGRTGLITCDDRPINEHMICSSQNVGTLKHDFVDYNRKSLTEWISKHNNYSSREAIALIDKDKTKYSIFSSSQYERKRWIRKHIWNNLPPVIRPFFYFIFRFILKLGFLDGRKVATYHFLHAFIYRVIIDFKYLELKWKKNK